MRAAFAALALFVATPSFAQSPQIYHLDIDAADLASVGTALNELPKRVADPLIAKLQSQIAAQNQATVEAAKKATAEAKAKAEADKTP